jgi:hypothetical protein
MSIPITKDAVLYLAGTLRSIIAMAEKDKSDTSARIAALAQAGLDLAEHGEEGCTRMRGGVWR